MTENSCKRYVIGGIEYIQRPIVLGQFNLLTPLLAGLAIRSGDIAELIGEFGERMGEALAIVLLPEGFPLPNAFEPQALQARIETLQWSITPEQTLEVVEDFFECNPVSSISERLGGMVTKLQESILERTISISSQSFTPSPADLSQIGTECSGEPPQQSLSGGLNSESVSEGTNSSSS